MIDVLVVGAGPAGMAAAIDLRSRGLTVTVADDQPSPGGRIFAAIEKREPHGSEDRTGASLVSRFRSEGGHYLPAAEVWGIEQGPRAFVTQAGRARMLTPRFILLATGAQERPMPFPGWQLPGVMTIGGAQILLKTAKQVPVEPVWLAGSGPLLLLYATQLISAGGKVAGILDTTVPHTRMAALKLLIGALAYGWRDMLRGMGWMARLKRLPNVRGVVALEAVGDDRLTAVRYRTGAGSEGVISTSQLFIHDGVIPAIHGTFAAGLEHRWNSSQHCFEPILDSMCASSDPSIFVAGDGASIAGARAAALSGCLAAIGIARAAGRLTEDEAKRDAAPLQRELAAAAKFRRFIDAAYPPAEMAIPDATMVCRCEEVTAQRIRDVVEGRPLLGPNGAKIATRAGMGPCQGRQCGLSLTRLITEAHGCEPEEAGFLGVRLPLKPLTLGELAALEPSS